MLVIAPSPSLMITAVLNPCDDRTSMKYRIAFFTTIAVLLALLMSMEFRLLARVNPSGVDTPISIAIFSIYIISIDKICACCTIFVPMVMSADGVTRFEVFPFMDAKSFPQIASAIWKSLADTSKFVPLFRIPIA